MSNIVRLEKRAFDGAPSQDPTFETAFAQDVRAARLDNLARYVHCPDDDFQRACRDQLRSLL